MQEFLIVSGLVLALFFWVWGHKSNTPLLFYVSAVFFIVIGVGVLSTGIERYEGKFLIETIDANTEDINSIIKNITQLLDPIQEKSAL